MIARSKPSERLREYQINSQYDWASFSSTPNDSTTSRVDANSVIWERVILSLLTIATFSLCFRCLLLTFSLKFLAFLLLVCLKIRQQVRLARHRKRRMLLPLSM